MCSSRPDLTFAGKLALWVTRLQLTIDPGASRYSTVSLLRTFLRDGPLRRPMYAFVDSYATRNLVHAVWEKPGSFATDFFFLPRGCTSLRLGFALKAAATS